MHTNRLKRIAPGGWKSLLAALIAAGALAACNSSGNGGSGDDNGDDSGNGNGTGGGESVTEVSNADRVLVYHSTEMNAGELELFVVDADDPNARSTVSPTPQYNRAARDESSVAWQGESFTAPDDTNLPLGVLGGDFNNGELTNTGYHYTVFNTPDGELYRLDAGGGDTTAERFSSESDASVICASFVASDLADIDNSRLVYQVAKDTSCEDTEIRMARIGDDESVDPVILFDDVAVEDSFQDLQFAELGVWLHDSNGALKEVVAYDGNEILAYNLADESTTTLESDSNHFAMLGYTDNGQTLVYAGDGAVVQVYEPGETPETLSFLSVNDWNVSFNTNRTRAVEADGKLYVVDAVGDRIVEIDGTSANAIYNPGGTNLRNARAVTYADGYIAFAYGSSVWNIHRVALDGSTAEDLVSNVSASFPVTSPSAPGSNGSYWFLYNDFGGTEDDPVAKGIEFTSGGGNFDMGNDTLWRGETWSTTVGETGYQAEYLFYQESGQEGALYSLDASDPANSSGQDMEVQDLTWGIWVSGFGPVTLMVGREDQVLQTNRAEVLYINAADAHSAVRLTDEMIDHRPVPFY